MNIYFLQTPLITSSFSPLLITFYSTVQCTTLKPNLLYCICIPIRHPTNHKPTILPHLGHQTLTSPHFSPPVPFNLYPSHSQATSPIPNQPHFYCIPYTQPIPKSTYVHTLNGIPSESLFLRKYEQIISE